MFMMLRLVFSNVFASTSRSIFALSSRKRSASTFRIVFARRTCWVRIFSRREKEKKRRWKWRARRRKKKEKEREKEKEWCSRRANRCKQTISNASSRFREEDVSSFCREECSSRNVSSKSSFFEKTHEETRKKTIRKEWKYLVWLQVYWAIIRCEWSNWSIKISKWDVTIVQKYWFVKQNNLCVKSYPDWVRPPDSS